MIEAYTSAGWRDFNQRYSGVYGFFPKPDGSEVLVYMEKVGETRCTFKDASDIAYYAQADKGVEFKFIPISKRVFMHDGRPTLARRVPARQYRRGICADNTVFVDVERGYALSVDFKSVYNYLNVLGKTDTTEVYDGIFSRVGQHFYLYDNRVASVTKDKVTMLLPIFKQEFADFTQRNKLEISIV